MKSLHYRLLGTPVTNDDCLARLAHEAPAGIDVEPVIFEYLREDCMTSVLVGRFIWDFPSGPRTIEERFGSYCLHHTSERVDAAIDRAESRLSSRLQQLASAGVEVTPQSIDFSHAHVIQRA